MIKKTILLKKNKKGKEFIYKGEIEETLENFVKRMHIQFPDAIIKIYYDPKFDQTSREGQCNLPFIFIFC